MGQLEFCRPSVMWSLFVTSLPLLGFLSTASGFSEGISCSCNANWWTYPQDNCCRDQSTLNTRRPNCATFRLNCNTVSDYDLSLCCPNPQECSCTDPWWTYRPGHCCYSEETKAGRRPNCAAIRLNCNTVTGYDMSLCCPNPRGTIEFINYAVNNFKGSAKHDFQNAL